MNSDGGVTKEEIQTVIDSCPQLPIEGEIEPPNPCLIVSIVLQYFDLIDQNGDGEVTIDEITGPISTVYPLPMTLLSLQICSMSLI